MDLITVKFLMTYTKRPLHLFGCVGFALSSIGFLVCSYLAYLWVLGNSIGDRPLLMLGVLLVIMGVQFISMGLIGELMTSAKKNDDYVVKK